MQRKTKKESAEASLLVKISLLLKKVESRNIMIRIS